LVSLLFCHDVKNFISYFKRNRELTLYPPF